MKSNDDLIAFFSFAFLQRRRSKAQLLQDLWVLFQTKEKRAGYFVEFGACDGVSLSNTLLLEKEYGWHGILAEPDPRWHKDLQANRDCQISRKCVYSESGQMIRFSCATIPELSRISDIVPDDSHERSKNRTAADVVNVEIISLLDLLREANAPKEIDYLSIDTEGSEELILRKFDFEAYQFGLITVEHAGETTKREAIYKLLTQQGYQRWHKEMSRWDDWYVLQK
ncbi:MAG: FkbM family methyltransferase [Devosiaceae bacterium]|nr:FkbM family methyltransferase [Devosiaceae bacterium]